MTIRPLFRWICPMMSNHHFQLFRLGVTIAALAVASTRSATAQMALGTEFTYQGSLIDDMAPADGLYDFRFLVFEESGEFGTVLGDVSIEDVQVTKGIFTVPIDFGMSVFTGEKRFLEVRVRPGDSTDVHERLLPRQILTAAPYALYAKNAAQADSATTAQTAMTADTATSATSATTAGNGVPIGTILPFAGVSPPNDDYRICDGSVLSRTEFADLFQAIGGAWGNGDSVTTFHIPDLRGLFLRGVDAGAGRDPDAGSRTALNAGGNVGDAAGSQQSVSTALPVSGFTAATAGSHTHNLNAREFWNDGFDPLVGRMNAAAGGPANFNIDSGGSHSHTVTGGDAETRPKNVYVNYLIKVK